MSFSDIASRFRQKAEETAAAQASATADPAEVMALRARISGVLIRDARLAKGYNTEQLAALMRVTTNEVIDWEFGKASPSLPQIELLAYWLEVPVSHFISGTETLIDQLAQRSLDQDEYLRIRDRMIGAEIRDAREKANFTREYLAELAGIDAELLQRYEYGQLAIPLPQLTQLATALRLNVSYFLEGNNRVGSFLQAEELFQTFLKMPPDLRDFIANPSSHSYIELAMKLAAMDTAKLRTIAENILEITL